jgi:murein DD-endopeptidase MepM/ murein hydrolase activator NlpD
MKQKLLEEIQRFKELTTLNESLDIPVPYNGVTSRFGVDRSYEKHPGVDLVSPSGTPVHSPDEGDVVRAEFSKGACGGTVTIKHPNGFQSRYCHLKEIEVSEGMTISKGKVIGLSGGDIGDKGRGNSKDAHLHFELKKDGVLVNPMDYVDKSKITYDDTESISGSSEEKELLDKILNTEFMGKKIKDLIGDTGKGLLDVLSDFAKAVQSIR